MGLWEGGRSCIQKPGFQRKGPTHPTKKKKDAILLLQLGKSLFQSNGPLGRKITNDRDVDKEKRTPGMGKKRGRNLPEDEARTMTRKIPSAKGGLES